MQRNHLNTSSEIKFSKSVFVGLSSLIMSSWLALWLWSDSTFAPYLGHGELRSITVQSNWWLLSSLFLLGWIIMMVAMMFPTSLSFFLQYYSVTDTHRLRLLGLLVGGYLAVWTVFGLFMYASDFLIHRIVSETVWLQDNVWIVPVSVLIFAGLYELT